MKWNTANWPHLRRTPLSHSIYRIIVHEPDPNHLLTQTAASTEMKPLTYRVPFLAALLAIFEAVFDNISNKRITELG
jgi:hypothetical protein